MVQAILQSAGAHTPLASVEGFLWHVIGWREYMRTSYRIHGRRMRSSKQLNHANLLGDGWWDGSTGLAPVDLVPNVYAMSQFAAGDTITTKP